ncbi:MAG: 30S ribosomal protein S1 [Chitinispirillales bacterium]|jgi:small subunit ribosomal protein S1|nr:30S ribosomal protein S1 [Chitinispirillales bacterium]
MAVKKSILTGVDASGNSVSLEDFQEEGYRTPAEIEQKLSNYKEKGEKIGSIVDIIPGEIVKGKILQITNKDVYVGIGYKSDGLVSVNEFRNLDELKAGDDVEVFVEKLEDSNGNLLLSKSRADFLRVWDRINEVHDNKEIIQGKLMKRVKGGIAVDLFGVDAFLPGSQIDLRQIPDLDNLLGNTFDLRVIKVNKTRRNIVVSRRAILEEERDKLRENVISTIEKGQVRKGVVKNITDFGVFIDLGGVDGLLHITDMSWGRIGDPKDILSIHQEIDVMVLDFNEDKDRISLGLKQLQEHPWKDIEKKYPEGSKVSGKIVSITEYGAFMELEKGIEGLIHISEMSWTQHIKHPSKIVSIGDIVSAVVLKIDRDSQKISLGLKQLLEDPWKNVRDEFFVGKVLTGKIRNIAAFGAFVELKDGIDGLIHVSDISWTKKVLNPGEVFKKGQEVEVKVIDVDEEKHRISLGIKQLTEDPWNDLSKKYTIGTKVEGKVVRILDRGIVLDFDDGIEGSIPTKEIGEQVEHSALIYSVGDKIPAEVIEFDLDGQKIVLSITEYFKGNAEGFEKYKSEHPIKKGVTIEKIRADEEAAKNALKEAEDEE